MMPEREWTNVNKCIFFIKNNLFVIIYRVCVFLYIFYYFRKAHISLDEQSEIF